MIDRSLRIALGISLGVHIFAMSAVVIITPDDAGRKKSFTRVDFLGPLLEKTAFDIMLESANPIVRTSYSWGYMPFGSSSLKVSSPGRMTFKPETFPASFESIMDNAVLDSLKDYKATPDFFLKTRKDLLRQKKWMPSKRNIMYRPEAPFFEKDLYGGKEAVNASVRALVSPDGKVKSIEPVTTTGYPQLDILAAKYVKSWIFEPRIGSEDEWVAIEVILEARD
jgi:hypothetical protein